MIRGEKTLTSTQHVDVLIIGAGASGGVAALAFARAGFSVRCLEQGYWTDPEHYPGNSHDWELRASKQWSSSPNVRKRSEDYPIDVTTAEIAPSNFNGVGGGTILYNANWPRLTPADFRVRSIDGVASDWPITYTDLLPFYERVDRRIGVSGLGGNPAYPNGADPPLPPLPIGRAGMTMARALSGLGWHWWPESNAIASVPFRGRHPCVQRGTCGQGCNEGAKGSIDLTHWPDAIAAGAMLEVGARVARIVIGPDGLAQGAEWLDKWGRHHFTPADVVLCAANGVGTARLLLMSATSAHADGLANSSGLVGKGLMVHPFALSVGLFDETLGTSQGHNGAFINSLQFYGTQPGANFVRGARWTFAPSGGPLRAAIGPTGEKWGEGHHRHLRERLDRAILGCLLAEDLPEDTNCVTLAEDLVDSSGLVAPKVTYTISANTRRILEFNIEQANHAFEAAGAWKVFSSITTSNGHLLGTARMGVNPSTSVVDPYGITHDISNLGIVDGSVFVTAGGLNPTSTICALALRASEHLIANRSSRRVPRRSHFTSMHVAFRAGRAPIEPASPGLSNDERDELARVASLLIPEVGTMPAAGSLGGFEDVLAIRSDLHGHLLRALRIAAKQHDLGAEELLAHIVDSDSNAKHALVTVIAGAYYRNSEVRDRIDYHGQEARTLNPFDFPEYVAEGLLDDVRTPLGTLCE